MRKTIFVLFGATGDLMRKKVLPALYSLEAESKLDSVSNIIGFSRREYSNEDFIEHLQVNVEKKLHSVDQETLEKLGAKTQFISSYFNEQKGYDELRTLFSEANLENTQILFYLSVAPNFYADIVQFLQPIKNEFSHASFGVLVEKPLGHNEESSKEINSILTNVFSEDEIFRIDHYLHKPIIDHIVQLRSENPLFESNWNNQSIESIRITTNEDFGVEERGSFYDPLGALLDVGQNHLMALLAVVTMHLPKEGNEVAMQQARAQILEKIVHIPEAQMATQTFRAQYNGYRDIENVEENSDTETYFKIRTEINLPRWRKVPIILEAGKRIEEHNKEVVITFKDGKVLTFSFIGDSGVFMDFQIGNNSQTTSLMEDTDNEQYVAEYKKLLVEAMAGNKTNFLCAEEVQAAWRFIDPIKNAWDSNKVELHHYQPDSFEPIHDSSFVENIDLQTAAEKKEIGLIGLGKMGGGVARQLRDNGWRVIVHNRSNEKVDEFVTENDDLSEHATAGEGAYEIDDMLSKLGEQKIVWVMVPSGKPIEEILLGEDGLIHKLSAGDIVIDAGNSNYTETIRRAKLFEEKGIQFVDAGISGGPEGARWGACSMVGGDPETFRFVEPIFRDMSLPGAYKFFKGAGAGHFVKMVHNGIEYGMMQAIGEGFEVMQRSPFNLDLKGVAEVYRTGSVISSSLINWLWEAFEDWGVTLDPISGEVHHSGEGQWTVAVAKELGIPVKVIEDALQFRINSTGNPSYTGQVVSALRGQFGGHSVGK